MNQLKEKLFHRNEEEKNIPAKVATASVHYHYQC